MTRVLLLTVALLCGACTSHQHTTFSGAALTEERNSAGRIFPYELKTPQVSYFDLDDSGSVDFRVKLISFASGSANGQTDNRVDLTWYQGRAPGPKPAVIILPIWGSYTYPPEKIAAGVRKMGKAQVNVLHVQGDSWVLDWDTLASAETEDQFLALMAENLQRIRTNVVDVSRILDWAATRPEIDPDRIGLVGFSHSGITASLAAINDSRLAATVILMAGAHPYRIFSSCRGRVGELREVVTSRFGWSVTEYEAALDPVTRFVDAAEYPGLANPSRILMFDAGHDKCIPLDAREALWQSLGQPERYSMSYGHKISFLAMTPLGLNWMRQPIYDFLDRKLAITES